MTIEQTRVDVLAALNLKVLAHRKHQPNHSSDWFNGDDGRDDSQWKPAWSIERAYSLPDIAAVTELLAAVHAERNARRALSNKEWLSADARLVAAIKSFAPQRAEQEK